MAVPVVALAERHLLTRLMHANAVSANDALRLDSLPLLQSRRLAHLLKTGVIKEAQPGTYYLNVPALADYQASRRLRMLLGVVAVVAVFAWWLRTRQP